VKLKHEKEKQGEKKTGRNEKDCGPLKASQSNVLEEEKVLGEREEGGRINPVGLPSIAEDWDDQEEDHRR
jgi:hypothetical protein